MLGTLYTFYSYKGGVGRSMAMANVAALLSNWGHKVLAIDWDLEAPGLEKYFMKEPSVVKGSRAETRGVVDLVSAFNAGTLLKWEDCLLEVYPFGVKSASFHILSAGQDTPDYVPTLQAIEWRRLFEKGFGAYLENLRDEWLNKYDFVLVDSRTGITDIGGVCTIHLPDVLVVLFTANEQSLNGVLDVMQRARAKYDKLPEEFERPPKLFGVPVPSRFEYYTEYESAARWLKKFAERLGSVYKEWLPEDVTPADVLDQLYVPNIPFWSFGEGLPVVQEGTTNPRSLGYAYDLLAKLLKYHLQWKDALRGDQPISEESTPESVNLQAERLFSALNDEEKELARRILLTLVLLSPAAKGHESRRPASLSEFSDQPSGSVIKKLTASGLLVVLHDVPSDEASVQIASDAILRSWERLRNWLEADRDFLLWRQQIRARLADWKNVESRSSSYLLSGPALETAVRFVKERGADLGGEELDYIMQSINESARVRRLARFKTTVSLAVILVIIIVSVFLAYRSYKKQQDSKAQELAFNRAVLSTSKGIDKFATGDTAGAIQDYDEALRNKSDYDAAYLNRGEAYLNLANASTDKAESDKLRGLAISDFQIAATLTIDDATRKTAEQDALEAQNPITPRQDPTPTATPTPRSTPSPSTSPGATPRPTASPQPSPILALNPRVYIQSMDDANSRREAAAWQAMLIKLGYTVMPLTIVNEVPQVTEVRYYRKSDAKEATQISMNFPGRNQPKYLVGFENSSAVRPRHFEVWVAVPLIKTAGQSAP